MSSSDKITIIRGDDINYPISFKDADGVAIDITDYTIFFTVKQNTEDSDDDALISVDITSHTDPTNGISALELTSAETDINPGLYTYDFQLKDADDKLSSSRSGCFEVLQDITQRVS